MKWLYSRKLSAMVLSFITTAFAAKCILSFVNFVKPYKTEISPLEKLTGTKGVSNC